MAEGHAGEAERSRQLFRRATAAQPASLPAWQAWAVMEGEAGNADAARRLFDRAEGIKPSPKTLSARATLERRCCPHKPAPAPVLSPATGQACVLRRAARRLKAGTMLAVPHTLSCF